MDFDSPSQGEAGQSIAGAAALNARRDREQFRELNQINKAMPEQGSSPVANRQAARDAILSEAHSLRRRAALLEELAMTLPTRMTPMADEALWDLIQRAVYRR